MRSSPSTGVVPSSSAPPRTEDSTAPHARPRRPLAVLPVQDPSAVMGTKRPHAGELFEAQPMHRLWLIQCIKRSSANASNMTQNVDIVRAAAPGRHRWLRGCERWISVVVCHRVLAGHVYLVHQPIVGAGLCHGVPCSSVAAASSLAWARFAGHRWPKPARLPLTT